MSVSVGSSASRLRCVKAPSQHIKLKQTSTNQQDSFQINDVKGVFPTAFVSKPRTSRSISEVKSGLDLEALAFFLQLIEAIHPDTYVVFSSAHILKRLKIPVEAIVKAKHHKPSIGVLPKTNDKMSVQTYRDICTKMNLSCDFLIRHAQKVSFVVTPQDMCEFTMFIKHTISWFCTQAAQDDLQSSIQEAISLFLSQKISIINIVDLSLAHTQIPVSASFNVYGQSFQVPLETMFIPHEWMIKLADKDFAEKIDADISMLLQRHQVGRDILDAADEKIEYYFDHQLDELKKVAQSLRNDVIEKCTDPNRVDNVKENELVEQVFVELQKNEQTNFPCFSEVLQNIIHLEAYVCEQIHFIESLLYEESVLKDPPFKDVSYVFKPLDIHLNLEDYRKKIFAAEEAMKNALKKQQSSHGKDLWTLLEKQSRVNSSEVFFDEENVDDDVSDAVIEQLLYVSDHFDLIYLRTIVGECMCLMHQHYEQRKNVYNSLLSLEDSLSEGNFQLRTSRKISLDERLIISRQNQLVNFHHRRGELLLDLELFKIYRVFEHFQNILALLEEMYVISRGQPDNA